ncbi:MAG: hypothetical protein ACYC1T_08000 [Sulfuricaulis sp.]
MTCPGRFVRLLSLWLVLALAAAPVLPSFAMTVVAGDAQAAHVTHDNHDGAMPDHSAPPQTPCTQHDSCNGQCCDLCAQCFSAVSALPLEQVRPHPVQSPVLTKFHPRIFSASPDRPPRFLSL